MPLFCCFSDTNWFWTLCIFHCGRKSGPILPTGKDGRLSDRLMKVTDWFWAMSIFHCGGVQAVG